MKKLTSLFIIAVSIVLISCVPARKYEELQNKQKQCEEDLTKYKDAAEAAEKSMKDMEEELARLKKDNSYLVRDSAQLGGSYRQLKETNNDLKDTYKDLLKLYNKAKKDAESVSANLSVELQLKEKELLLKEDELKRLELSLMTMKLDLEKKKSDMEAQQKRIDELEELLRKKDEMVNALKDKVYNALLSFKDKGLTVEEKNGKVYVKMEAKLLFATGSTKVGPEGQKALIELAKVLQDQKDMEVVVEGHTDSDKLNSSSYPHNNWELSVLRATSVVKIMTDNSSVSPKILSASGRSEYHPVGDDKAKNRRIEVILTPNLDELYKLINNN